MLVLTAATGRCWLLVRVGSASGRTVYERTLEQGQTVRLGLRKPLWIEIGAPWALRAMIGRRLVLPIASDENRKRTRLCLWPPIHLMTPKASQRADSNGVRAVTWTP